MNQLKGLACILPGLTWLAVVAQAQTQHAPPDIRPIESLWLTSPQLIKGPSTGSPMSRGLKEWRSVFDAIMLIKLPPTFADDKDYTARANAMIKEVGGRFLIVTLPVGTEGWETSANQRLAQKQGGDRYDAARAVSQTEWLSTLEGVDSDTWGWILEQPARMPTPDQAAKSASEFVKFAKSRHKKTAIWLSGEAFGNPRFKAVTERVCEATRADADFIGWMDLPAESLKGGEGKWRETLAALLDRIVALVPKEKTVIQWAHNPAWPVKDVEGAIAYIGVCQAKGINRFCALSGPDFLNRDPWRDFYRGLAKTGH